MSAPPIPHEQVHRDLDAHYFADYALFTGAVRQYVAKTLEQSFSESPNDIHRRLLIVGLYKEEYSAYEDLGAVLEAFIRWRRGEVPVPFEAILRYKDERVLLSNLFQRRNIENQQDLYGALQLDDMVPLDWEDTFPDIDCRAGLIGICTYFFGDCLGNQKRYGVEAYNRIKHGLALFPNGKFYVPQLPNCPAVIINNRDQSNPNPYTMMAMPMGDESIKQRARTVEFVQASIRTLTTLYVLSQYPAYSWPGTIPQPGSKVFLSPSMSDVMNFFTQISAKHV